MNVFKSRRDAVPCDERLFITESLARLRRSPSDLSALQKHEHVRLMLSFIVAAIIVIISILVLFFNQFYLHNLLAFYVFCYYALIINFRVSYLKLTFIKILFFQIIYHLKGAICPNLC